MKQFTGTGLTPTFSLSNIAMLLLVTLLVSTSAPVSALEPVFDIVDADIISATPKTMDSVKKAIIAGAATRKWRLQEIGPGHLEAQIIVRKHVAKVDIVYSETNYSITYKETENLKYNNGKIHKNYNRWIRNLDLAIQKSLSY